MGDNLRKAFGVEKLSAVGIVAYVLGIMAAIEAMNRGGFFLGLMVAFDIGLILRFVFARPRSLRR